jgi:hypothetical protein
MFVVNGEDEHLVCSLCQQPFVSLSVAWLGSPPDGGEALWGHRHCLEKYGVRLFGGFRYRLRRGDSVIRAVVQRLLTHDGLVPIVRWDRGG